MSALPLIFLLFAAGALVLVAELIIPSHGVLTVLAIGLLIAGVVHTFRYAGQQAGMIAALASQGLSPNDAACAGVFLHGMSADLLVRDHPMTPVTATDVIGNIRGALHQTLGESPPEEG